MSPLMLVLFVMFTPPDEPICLFFILDAKSLSATTIDRGAGEDRGQDREDRRPVDAKRRVEGGGNGERGQKRNKDRTGKGQEMKVWGEKEKRTVQVQEFMTYSIGEFKWIYFIFYSWTSVSYILKVFGDFDL